MSPPTPPSMTVVTNQLRADIRALQEALEQLRAEFEAHVASFPGHTGQPGG